MRVVETVSLQDNDGDFFFLGVSSLELQTVQRGKNHPRCEQITHSFTLVSCMSNKLLFIDYSWHDTHIQVYKKGKKREFIRRRVSS